MIRKRCWTYHSRRKAPSRSTAGARRKESRSPSDIHLSTPSATACERRGEAAVRPRPAEGGGSTAALQPPSPTLYK